LRYGAGTFRSRPKKQLVTFFTRAAQLRHKMESLIWILAGALILISVWLAQWVSQWWLLLAILVGGYLVVSGFTGFCPVKTFSRKKHGEKENDHDVIDD
jgi:hypothetical protein